jgi:hypothetical protein
MFKYQIKSVNGPARSVTVNEVKWPFEFMNIGDYFIVQNDPIEWANAKSKATAFNSPFRKLVCTTIRNRDGYFRHGIITRTD